MGRFIDMIGMEFGKLKVIEFHGIGKDKKTKWLVECACKSKIIVNAGDLRLGKSKSCGCTRVSVKHGYARKANRGRIYSIWKQMRQRCLNLKKPNFHNYGGRGITICDEWNDYKVFHSWAISNGYEDGLTIDRINNDGNYEPLNCRWATKKEQGNNTRRTIFITYNNIHKPLTFWSEYFKIEQNTLRKRMLTMTFEEAIKKPLRKSTKRVFTI